MERRRGATICWGGGVWGVGVLEAGGDLEARLATGCCFATTDGCTTWYILISNSEQ